MSKEETHVYPQPQLQSLPGRIFLAGLSHGSTPRPITVLGNAGAGGHGGGGAMIGPACSSTVTLVKDLIRMRLSLQSQGLWAMMGKGVGMLFPKEETDKTSNDNDH